MTHLKPMPIVAPPTAETRQDALRARGPAGGAARRRTCAPRAHTRAAGPIHLLAGIGSRRKSPPRSPPAASRPRGRTRRRPRGSPAPGRHVIIATRAASGKSAGYLAAALSEVLDGGTVLYIAPTKALAADQLKSVRDLGAARRPRRLLRRRLHGRGARLGAVARQLPADQPGHGAQRAAAEPRPLARLLPPPAGRDHRRVPRLPRRFRLARRPGAAQAAPRRRCTASRGATRHRALQPVFILASATIADPDDCARKLTGLDAVAVTEDGSPRAPVTFALWEPPLLHSYAEARARRPATSEAADLLAALVKAEVPALAFIRSRRGAETVALAARDALDEELSGGVAAYRSGYLPDDRRGLEAGLRDGRITGMAATTALELGINITGLDAVLIAGWPGTWASLWQQAGRAGRAGQHATAVFIARDDPLDSYLVHHPETLLHHPVEPAVLDPAQPVRARPAPGRRRGGAAADRARPRPVRRRVRQGGRRPGRGGRAAQAAVRLVLRPAPPPGQGHLASAATSAGRCAWSRRQPGGWSAPWTSRPRTATCTTAPSTCTRASRTWSACLTWPTGWRWSRQATPATPPRPATSPTSTSSASAAACPGATPT